MAIIFILGLWCDGTACILGAWLAMKIRRQEVARIGMFDRGINGGCGVMQDTIQAHTREVCEASSFHTALLGPIPQDNVSTADDACMTVGVVQGIGIAGIKEIVGEDHAFAAIPRATPKGVGAVEDGVVDDLEVECLALMIRAGKACTSSIDEHVVAHDGLSLHLHDIVPTVVAKIALDDVHGLSCCAIDGDAGVVRIVHMVLGDQVSPRALLHLDAIPLITATVMNVI